jgi:hypothetical protein
VAVVTISTSAITTSFIADIALIGTTALQEQSTAKLFFLARAVASIA